MLLYAGPSCMHSTAFGWAIKIQGTSAHTRAYCQMISVRLFTLALNIACHSLDLYICMHANRGTVYRILARQFKDITSVWSIGIYRSWNQAMQAQSLHGHGDLYVCMFPGLATHLQLPWKLIEGFERPVTCPDAVCPYLPLMDYLFST